MKATLKDLLTEVELHNCSMFNFDIRHNQPIIRGNHTVDIASITIDKLTTKDLSDLSIVIDMRIVKNRKIPSGNLVSFVWEELVERAIEKQIDIF